MLCTSMKVMDHYKPIPVPYGANGTNGTNGTSGHDKMTVAKEKAAEYFAVGKEKGSLYLEKAEQFIRTKPAAAIGIALGAGWLIGRLLKARRKDDE